MKNYPYNYRIASDGILFYLQERKKILWYFEYWKTVFVHAFGDECLAKLKEIQDETL